jgi:fucose 4-O-acetylase-like acetyltransferase
LGGGEQLNRVVALDIVKAVAICLLVLGHVIEGLTHMGAIDAHSPLIDLQAWLRTFRMPAFFFAAGAVTGLRALRPAGPFLHHRFATLVYPHLLWGAIYLVIAIVFARYYNSPIQDPGNIGRHLMDIAIGQKSWFLMSLFMVSVAAYFLFRIDARLALVLALLLCVLPIDSRFTSLSRSFDFAFFFVLGYMGIGALLRLTAALPLKAVLALGIAALPLSFGLQKIMPALSHPMWGGASLLILGLMGAFGLWCLAVGIAASDYPRRKLAALGAASLAIFVLHPMVIGAARLVLVPLMRDLPSVIPTLLIATIAVALPALAYYFIKRLGLVTPIFILPLARAEASDVAHGEPSVQTSRGSRSMMRRR